MQARRFAPGAAKAHLPMRQRKALCLTYFHDFGLNDAITRSLTEEKYLTPTPIQAQTIPIVMSGRDVIGIAQTGTGKTAAFALPILHHLAANPRAPVRKSCRVLVLSPTRELSGQILDSFPHLRPSLAHQGHADDWAVCRWERRCVRSSTVSMSLSPPPGRLLDLVQSNALRLGDVECLVLDEADRMLDMGFIHDIRKIVAKLPAKRQTLMFSATMPARLSPNSQRICCTIRPMVAVTPEAPAAERIEQRMIPGRSPLPNRRY